jgi:hypothetical protein
VTSAKGALIDALTADEAQKLVGKKLQAQAPEIARVLAQCGARVPRGRWDECTFLDRQADGAMLMEFFTRDGVGTVMTQAPLARLRDATIDDVGAILRLIEPLEADGTLVKRGRERLEMESHPLLSGRARRRGRWLCRAVSVCRRKVGRAGLRCRDAGFSPQRLWRPVAYRILRRAPKS